LSTGDLFYVMPVFAIPHPYCSLFRDCYCIYIREVLHRKSVINHSNHDAAVASRADLDVEQLIC